MSKETKSDLVGRKFNKLTLKKYLGRKNNRSMWLCQCDCGSPLKELPEHDIKSNAVSTSS